MTLQLKLSLKQNIPKIRIRSIFSLMHVKLIFDTLELLFLPIKILKPNKNNTSIELFDR